MDSDGNGEYAQAFITGFFDNCLRPLAYFDTDNKPFYDEINRRFEFKYVVPNQCGSLNATTYVYYTCYENIPTAKLLFFDEIRKCEYRIRIGTALACI